MDSEAQIDALFADWKRAVAERDTDRILELVTEDCEFWSNSAPSIRGRVAVRDTFAAFLMQYEHRQDFERQELVISQDLAFVRGLERNYLTPRGGGPEIQHPQRAFMILQRQQNGGWLFARGMTNLPPKDPSPLDAPA